MASRPGKYAHVTGKLPRYDAIEPERRDLVNSVKAAITAPLSDVELADFNRAAQIHNSLTQMDAYVQALLTIAKRLAVGKMHAAGFASSYADVRVLLDKIGDWKSSTQLLVDAYEELMLDAYEAEGVASMRLENGASVSTSQEPYGKVVDKEAFRLWCIANGYGGQLQLWPSSMNALAKERTLAGEAPPTGVEVFAKTIVRLNKA